MLYHPAVAQVPCSECQRFVYDLKTGKRETYQAGSAHNELPVPRNGPPPCELGHDCPKQSPDREHLHVLTERNRRMLELYSANRAFQGHLFAPHEIDGLTRLGFVICDSFFRASEQRDLADAIALRLLPLKMRP